MIKTTLKIEGMACGMCEAHINDCVRRNFKIKKITTSYSKGKSEILSDIPPEEDKLRKVIAETGYAITSVKSEPYIKKGLFSRL